MAQFVGIVCVKNGAGVGVDDHSGVLAAVSQCWRRGRKKRLKAR